MVALEVALEPSPYRILGVAKDATLDSIRSAHRKGVLRTHPDKVREEDDKAQKLAEFHAMQEAYFVLGDDERRRRYDERVKLAELKSEISQSKQQRVSPDRSYQARKPHLVNRGAFKGVYGLINGHKVQGLADTGADHNFLNRDFSRSLNLRPVYFDIDDRPTFVMGHGRHIQAVGKVRTTWLFRDKLHLEYHITFYILLNSIFDIMLGGTFLFATKTMTLNKHRMSLMSRPKRALAVRMVNLCGTPSRRLVGMLSYAGCSALPDSGAEPNLLSYAFVKQKGWLLDMRPGPDSCHLLIFADGSTEETEGQLRLQWTFSKVWDLVPSDADSFVVFDVLRGCPHDVVLGQDFLNETDPFSKHDYAFVDIESETTASLNLVIRAWPGLSSKEKGVGKGQRRTVPALSKKSAIWPMSEEEHSSNSDSDGFDRELQRRADHDADMRHLRTESGIMDTKKAQESFRRSQWEAQRASSTKPSDRPTDAGPYLDLDNGATSRKTLTDEQKESKVPLTRQISYDPRCELRTVAQSFKVKRREASADLRAKATTMAAQGATAAWAGRAPLGTYNPRPGLGSLRHEDI